jgi:uncharacterized damage-inducible protein DinB
LIRTKSGTLTAAAILVALATAVPAGAQISEQDRTKAVKYLTTTRDQVLAESAKLSDAQWNFKPGPDRWSVGEVVEHLALAENFIFDLQQKTMSSPAPDPEKLAKAKGQDDVILKQIPDRTQKAKAPEPLQPSGKTFKTRDETLAAFKERRGKTIDYAGKTKDDLRGRVGDSPLGPMDGYQWLLFAAAHSERHLKQIQEVKADAKFPKAATQ